MNLGYESIFLVLHDEDVGGDFARTDVIEKRGTTSQVIVDSDGASS